MSTAIYLMIGLLAVWMLSSAWCGFRARYLRFLGILAIGLFVNGCWMVWGLQARPFEPHAIVAQVSAAVYAICAFCFGWFGGRIHRAWHESDIAESEV